MSFLKFFRSSENSWRFEYPEELFYYQEEYFYNSLDIMYSDTENAQKKLIELIRLFPYHIDAYVHLGIIDEYIEKDDRAFLKFQKALEIGLECFPKNNEFVIGKDLIEWSYLENRPFLRAYHCISLLFWKKKKYEKAFEIWEKLLKFNPNDNQGIRSLYAIGCLELKKYNELKDIKTKYIERCDMDINLSLALVYYISNEYDIAKKYLDYTYKYYENELKFLLNKSVKKPEIIGSECRGIILYSDEYSLYEFYSLHKKYWRKTKGSINFLRKFIAGK
jgi:tetratricopeptide (TPR) repeat protein